MTESEAEELETPVLTPELLPEQKFHVMVKEANLDESRAGYLLKQFSEHFKEAAEWAKKANDIIVTNENQTVMMEIARTGRLFLSKKRQDIERARKWMKEPALREGQAIDKIANLLKDTIIPTEEHLRRQEDFVKLRQEAEAERIRLEVEARMEQERIAEENRKAQENARLQAENERLRNEQKKIAEENARKIAEENRKRQEELARVQAENKVKLDKERQEREKVEEELRAKKQAELKAEADKIREQERLLKAEDGEKLLILRKQLIDIKIPKFKSAYNQRIADDIKSYVCLAILKIKTDVNEEEE